MPERGSVLWWSPPLTVAVCLLLGVVIGAGTNLVNTQASAPAIFAR